MSYRVLIWAASWKKKKKKKKNNITVHPAKTQIRLVWSFFAVRSMGS